MKLNSLDNLHFLNIFKHFLRLYKINKTDMGIWFKKTNLFSNIFILPKEKITFKRMFLSLSQIKWANPCIVIVVTMWSQLFLIMSGVDLFMETKREKYNKGTTCHFFLLLTSKAQERRRQIRCEWENCTILTSDEKSLYWKYCT